MKTATLLFLAMLAAGADAQAPAGPPPDGPAGMADCLPGKHAGHMGRHGKGRHLERLQQELELDDAQKAKVEGVFRAHMEKHRAEREAKMAAMHAELRTELAKVLTPEQLVKFDAKHAERQAKMQKWRERHEGAGAP